MAIKSNNTTQIFPVRKIISRKRFPSFNAEEIDKRILKCDFYSLRPIARRQAIAYQKQLICHPNRRIYIKMINLVILHDKFFRNLFCSKICNKKSEEDNE